MEDSVRISEHSLVSLTVQSRISPTEVKMASHCLREICLTGESLRGATPSDEEKGDRLEPDGNAVGAGDLYVRAVPLECLGEGPAELETILLRAKGGRSG